MTMPKRIQRKRTKGWRMPEGAVYVGRPSRWGNPFVVKKSGDKWTVSVRKSFQIVPFEAEFLGRTEALEYSVRRFRGWAKLRLMMCPTLLDPLRGKDLACWCRLDKPCHADVWLELANDTN